MLVCFVAAAALVLLLSVHFGLLGFGNAGIGAMADGFQWQAVGAGASRVAFSFFAGVLLFRVWRNWRPRVNIPPIIVAATLAAVLVADPAARYQSTFDLVATFFVFPLIIFFGASSTGGRWMNAVFSTMGAASYAIYVLQETLYDWVRRLLRHLSIGAHSGLPWGWTVAFVAFVLGIGMLADRYVDRPTREALSGRLLKPWRRGQLGPTGPKPGRASVEATSLREQSSAG